MVVNNNNSSMSGVSIQVKSPAEIIIYNSCIRRAKTGRGSGPGGGDNPPEKPPKETLSAWII